MKKSEALRLLGGTPSAAAKAIGISTSAVSQWPDDETGELPDPIRDRVQAAIARRHLPAEMIGGTEVKAA